MNWIKLGAVLAALALGGYVKARLDRANEADDLARQVADMTKASTEKDEKVKSLEKKKQANRFQADEFNRQWSNIRAEKNRPVCQLDDPTRSLLRSASDWNPR